MTLCTAKSSRTGEPCRAHVVLGARVCVAHGGAAPQVRQSARERLLAFVDPALDQLRRLIDTADSDSVKLSAIKDVLDRCGYKVPEKIDIGGKQVIEVEFVAKPLPIATNGHVLESRR
jgi:hypothetical protein